MRPSALAALLLLGGGMLFVASPAVAAQALLPHRAIYELSLEKASDRSGINAIDGRMVYEFEGSACAGYTTRFRFVTRIVTDEVSRLTDLQKTTYEDGEGKTFRFESKSYIDQVLDQEVDGKAETESSGTVVRLEKPEKRVLKLQPTQFPTTHLQELLRKVEAGEHFYQTTLFDAADDADQVMKTTVVAGRPKPMSADDPERRPMKGLADDTFWPVTIAYFSGDKEGGEETPDYDISFKLHKSGITRDLTMGYGEFSIHGRLVDLTLLKPESKCGSAQ